MHICLTVSFVCFQICRVEDITVEGLVKGSVVNFHRARTIDVQASGTISASGMGTLLFSSCRKVLVMFSD